MQYGERTSTAPTEPGWYYVGMDGDQNCGPILQFEDGAWFDEEGEEVDRLWCADLQVYTSVNGADFWIRQ
jgi:hypothetical protein